MTAIRDRDKPIRDRDKQGRNHHHPKSATYPGGSITRQHRMDGRWWVWPLPPPGRLDFICRLGETETRLSIEAQLILDASHRSTQAWPNA
jgi:hypothetical protein